MEGEEIEAVEIGVIERRRDDIVVERNDRVAKQLAEQTNPRRD